MPTRVSKRQAAKGPVKVKSSTIGAIKKTGMTKALGNITPAQRKNAAYMTGLKRMYGAARVNKALGSGNRAVPVGGVMGTSKNNKVMGGSSVKSTMKSTAKKTTKSSASKKRTGGFKNSPAYRLGSGMAKPFTDTFGKR